MTPRYRDARIAVYDDFLGEAEQKAILRYFDTAQFRSILPAAWGSAYRLYNGSPLVGMEVASERIGAQERVSVYPTHTPLDLLIEQLLACRAQIAEIVGSHGQEWTGFTACPYVYPAGSGLGWHTDAHYAGAYIYYAHPSWALNWGGELLVEYAEKDCSVSTLGRGIAQRSPLESALSHRLGYYFGPLPNRLIILRGHTPHMIKTVEAAAGDNLRLSISGFFLSSQMGPQPRGHSLSP